MSKQLNIGNVDNSLCERFEVVKASLCSKVKSVVRSSKGFEFLICCAERELGIFEEDDIPKFTRGEYSFILIDPEEILNPDGDGLPEYNGEQLDEEGEIL